MPEIANFTPLSALAGGVVIGLAASLLWLLGGRTAGVSGILGGVVPPLRARLGVAGAVPGRAAGGRRAASGPGARPGWTLPPRSLPVLAVAGLLVGFGTRLAGGCTSGHGVCGLSRLSRRSLVATLVFMAAAMITVAVLRLTGRWRRPVMKPGPLAFGCGLLFALGLGLSGMTQPSKVLAFLDVGRRLGSQPGAGDGRAPSPSTCR